MYTGVFGYQMHSCRRYWPPPWRKSHTGPRDIVWTGLKPHFLLVARAPKAPNPIGVTCVYTIAYELFFWLKRSEPSSTRYFVRHEQVSLLLPSLVFFLLVLLLEHELWQLRLGKFAKLFIAGGLVYWLLSLLWPFFGDHIWQQLNMFKCTSVLERILAETIGQCLKWSRGCAFARVFKVWGFCWPVIGLPLLQVLRITKMAFTGIPVDRQQTVGQCAKRVTRAIPKVSKSDMLTRRAVAKVFAKWTGGYKRGSIGCWRERAKRCSGVVSKERALQESGGTSRKRQTGK